MGGGPAGMFDPGFGRRRQHPPRRDPLLLACGRRLSPQARGDSRQSGRVDGARPLRAVRRRIAVFDRSAEGRARCADSGAAAPARPRADLPDARAGLARTRHRGVPRVDARDARIVVPLLARRAFQQRVAQGNAPRSRRVEGAHHAQRVHGLRRVSARAARATTRRRGGNGSSSPHFARRRSPTCCSWFRAAPGSSCCSCSSSIFSAAP